MEYGKINVDNHSMLKHVEAKAATTEAEGNIEYWYCEGCHKYFSDKDGKNEIELADTVIAKLAKTDKNTKSPETGNYGEVIFSLVIALVGCGAILIISTHERKKFLS